MVSCSSAVCPQGKLEILYGKPYCVVARASEISRGLTTSETLGPEPRERNRWRSLNPFASSWQSSFLVRWLQWAECCDSQVPRLRDRS
jgi:hypothetical protein